MSTSTLTTSTPTGTGESFVHLHVASGYSMRYGTAKPHQLVERAAAFGQPALALTDRDGLYGAVKFVRACMEHDVAPILGVDLAIGPEQPERHRPVRTPVRGGALVDPRLPRVTVLARGSSTGLAPGEGWAALCRLVTATHLRGERGNPVTTLGLVAEHVRALPSAPTGSTGSTGSAAPSETPSRTPSATPSRSESSSPSPSATADDLVTVDPAAYVGRPKDEAKKDLEDLGLEVDDTEVDNPGDQEKDTVADVSPSGQVEPDSTVTLSVYGDPPKQDKPGNGNGNDNGKGNDD